MKLGMRQLSNLGRRVEINNKLIVQIRIPDGYKSWPVEEVCYNIYCVDNDYNIIWQVSEPDSKPVNNTDAFVYLGTDKDGNIIADRASGFVYKLDPETGVAKRTGFHK